MRALVFSFLFSTSACADTSAIETAARLSFENLPEIVQVDNIMGNCGADAFVNRDAAYCTSENVIYARLGAENLTYKVSHLFGHAIQVQHGIADIALREVRARPGEEVALRGMVTRQVECLAGFLHAQADLPAFDLLSLAEEPFRGSHWGRNPLRVGPQVSIGLEVRAEWFYLGYDATEIAVCSVGEITSELLEEAYIGD